MRMEYLSKKGEIFETFEGHLIFTCCICSATNLGLKEVESHLKLHVNDIIKEEFLEEYEATFEHDYYKISDENQKEIKLEAAQQVTDISNSDNEVIDVGKPEPEPQPEVKSRFTNNKLKQPMKCRTIKNIRQVQNIQCDLCGRTYANKTYFKRHLNCHMKIKPYKCNICGHGFADQQNLKTHINRHNGIKPYKCYHCDKLFSTSTELKIHIRSHTGEKTKICSICGKQFITSSKLSEHTRRAHTNERRHKCDFDGCTQAYFKPRDLTIHMRSHTGERPLVCDICDKTFGNPKTLKNHKQLHEPEKLFSCRYCTNKFSQSSGRRGHEKRVHSAV